MKRFHLFSLGFVALAALFLYGCSSSNEEDADEFTENVVLRSCTISEGEEVDASSTTSVTLTYSKTVAAMGYATLNGVNIMPTSNSVTSMAIDIALDLEPGTSYTLTVTRWTVYDTSNPYNFAPEFTLNFTTKAAKEVTEATTIDTLSDALATTEAQALYSTIQSYYGLKTMSAVVANVNWNHTEADNVYSITGKYPAFNCYDFIHIYVPENNWIDYTDLTPVTEWVDAGGLVQLMWHFNVPLTETTSVTSSGSGVTCTYGATTFEASNALVSGTWEYNWFYQEMEKVADIILQLQDLGIAAVWRPFHEGAGNACLKSGASWGTAWFWWGGNGAETYKNLWYAMYDYFQTKGIHNLIWVWTSQNYNGDSTTYNNDDDWYPGDAYVDMIGRDLYGYTASACATEFADLTARYPNKMITLAECGVNGSTAFANVSDMWNAGAAWSWFMPWYGDSMPANSWWSDAMNCSNVVTRSDL